MALIYKSLSGRVPDYYKQKNEAEKKVGHKLSCAEFEEKYLIMPDNNNISATGTSVFDPVLAEVFYLWHTAEGDSIIDPFAGGSVRGIVAEKMGRRYTGIDLRQEQIDANEINAGNIFGEHGIKWICGDSRNIKSLAAGKYDFIFSCPPYGDLEKYSEDERDLSNLNVDEFAAEYEKIIAETADLLENDRFAAFVVGNYRDKKGCLVDLVGSTVRAFENAGLRYYNDYIFVTPCGGLPTRMGAAFKKSRKFGRRHQYCLVFVKGDPKKATERLGDVEIPDMSSYVEEEG